MKGCRKRSRDRDSSEEVQEDKQGTIVKSFMEISREQLRDAIREARTMIAPRWSYKE